MFLKGLRRGEKRKSQVRKPVRAQLQLVLYVTTLILSFQEVQLLFTHIWTRI